MLNVSNLLHKHFLKSNCFLLIRLIILLSFDEHFNEVIKKYINNEGPPIHADAGKRTLELASASIKSFKTNKTVEL